MNLSIYTAGAWARRSEIRAYADRLQQLGYEVPSRWLTADQETLAEAAAMDAADLKNAFQYLPQVSHFTTVEHLVEWLGVWYGN